MDAALEVRQPSNSRTRGKLDAQRGGYKPWEFSVRHVFSFVSRGCAQGEIYGYVF